MAEFDLPAMFGMRAASRAQYIRFLLECCEYMEGACRQLAFEDQNYIWSTFGHKFFGGFIPQKVRDLDRRTGMRSKVVLPENYRRPNWQ